MIDLSDAAAAGFMRLIGAAAVYVASTPWNMHAVGYSNDLKSAHDVLHQDHYEMQWAGWVRSVRFAEWLAFALHKYFRNDGDPVITALPIPEIIHNIETVAQLV